MIKPKTTGSGYSLKRPSPFIRREGRPELSRLTVICCCAGYGKTAYLSQLHEDIENSILVSFDSLDDSSFRIVSLLSEALSEPSGECRDIAGYTGGLISALCAKGVTLLIDNADRLSSPEAASLLCTLAQAALCGKFRIVFAVRQIPGFLLEYLMENAEGQLCFTTHNIGPMDILKKNKKSIDFLSEDHKIYSWTNNGNYSPSSLYKNGMIEGSAFNVFSFDFLSAFHSSEDDE